MWNIMPKKYISILLQNTPLQKKYSLWKYKLFSTQLLMEILKKKLFYHLWPDKSLEAKMFLWIK